MKVSEEQVKKRIRDAGLRATPQRIHLLRILMETPTHPSAEMLMTMSNESGFELSIGTVYNTLEYFENKGLVIRVHDASEVMRYDAKTDFHVHLVDREHNVIMDFFDDELEGIIKGHLKGKVPAEFSAKHIDISLYA